MAATATMRGTARAHAIHQPSPAVDAMLWTFEHPQFVTGSRIRVRVDDSGFVHAGVADADGVWNRVY